MFKIFNKKVEQNVLATAKKKKPTLYDNLIYNGHRYSLVKAIDISLSIQKILFNNFEKEINDCVRIRSNLAFQSKYTDICSIEGVKDGVIEIVINNSGFAGIEGTIPDPYIEQYILYNRISKQAILDFFDIFNHAVVMTRYFFDKKHVAECLSVRANNSLIGRIISSISGFDFYGADSGKEMDLLPSQFKISAQNLFWRYSRSADMLKILLSSLFDADIAVEQFVGGLTNEAPYDDLTRIGVIDKKHNALGKTTLLGSKTWDSTLGIIINVRDLSLNQYIDFLPKASEKDNKFSKLTKIKEIIKMYIPSNIKAKLVFTMKRENVHGAYLNGIGRLNKDLFIGGVNSNSAISFSEYV